MVLSLMAHFAFAVARFCASTLVSRTAGPLRIFLIFCNFLTCELHIAKCRRHKPTLSILLEMTFFHVTCATCQFRPPAKKRFSRILNFEQQPQLRQKWA
jgi:hypothetical protein